MTTRAAFRSWITWSIAMVFLSTLLLCSLCVVDYLPTNDGPQHIFSAFVENHYNDPGSIYPIYLDRLPQFAYRGFAVIMKPLEEVFGWQKGVQIALALILLLNAWGFGAMVLALNPRRKWLCCLGFPLAWSWNLYMGFLSFAVGSGMGFWIIAYVLAIKRWNLVRRTTLSALLFAQACAHIFSAVLTAMVVSGLLIFIKATWKQRYREILILALVGLPTLYAAVMVLLTWEGVKADGITRFVWVPWAEQIFLLPKIFIPGPWHLVIPMLALVVAGIISGLRRLEKSDLSTHEKTLFWVAITFIAVACFGPRDIPGWQGFSQRFVPVGISVALLQLPLEKFIFKRSHLIVGLAMLLFATYALVINRSVNLRLAAESSDFISIIHAPLVTNSNIHYIPLGLRYEMKDYKGKAGIPYLHPEFQGGTLYAVVTKSMPSNLFAGSISTHALIPKPSGLTGDSMPYARFMPTLPVTLSKILVGQPNFSDDPTFRSAVLSRLGSSAMNYWYDRIFVTGARDSDIEAFKNMGFVEDWRHKTAWVSHFKPCTLIVQGKKPNKLNVGLWPHTAIAVFEEAKGRAVGDATQYDWVPCGDIWVKGDIDEKQLSLIDPDHRGLPSQVHVVKP